MWVTKFVVNGVEHEVVADTRLRLFDMIYEDAAGRIVGEVWAGNEIWHPTPPDEAWCLAGLLRKAPEPKP